jgi:hypothetical protein
MMKWLRRLFRRDAPPKFAGGEKVLVVRCAWCINCEYVGKVGTVHHRDGTYNGVPVWWVVFADHRNGGFKETDLELLAATDAQECS